MKRKSSIKVINAWIDRAKETQSIFIKIDQEMRNHFSEAADISFLINKDVIEILTRAQRMLKKTIDNYPLDKIKNEELNKSSARLLRQASDNATYILGYVREITINTLLNIDAQIANELYHKTTEILYNIANCIKGLKKYEVSKHKERHNTKKKKLSWQDQLNLVVQQIDQAQNKKEPKDKNLKKSAVRLKEVARTKQRLLGPSENYGIIRAPIIVDSHYITKWAHQLFSKIDVKIEKCHSRYLLMTNMVLIGVSDSYLKEIEKDTSSGFVLAVEKLKKEENTYAKTLLPTSNFQKVKKHFYRPMAPKLGVLTNKIIIHSWDFPPNTMEEIPIVNLRTDMFIATKAKPQIALDMPIASNTTCTSKMDISIRSI